MKNNLLYIKISLLILISLSLFSCGFHLNGLSGDYKFPFKSAYIQCDGVAICSNLTNAIKTQSLTTLMPTPESAEVTIRLFNEQTARDAAGFTAVGRISSYLLTYQAQVQVLQKGVQIGDDINLAAHATMQYNDSTILSDKQEETNFWDQLHQAATNQLIRRLIYLKKNKE